MDASDKGWVRLSTLLGTQIRADKDSFDTAEELTFDSSTGDAEDFRRIIGMLPYRCRGVLYYCLDPSVSTVEISVMLCAAVITFLLQ